MRLKKKYYFIGILLLLCFIIGYHFYAAYQAEQQIDTAIQEQTAQTKTISVQYSSINVSPFSGSVSFNDLTVIFGNHIERAQRLQFKATYFDFLNIYFGGLQYGLDHLGHADVAIDTPSYVNRSGLEEVKANTLHIVYHGDALDGLKATINGTSFRTSQKIEAQSTGLIIQLPHTTFNKLVAKKFSYTCIIKPGKQNFWAGGNHQFALDSLTWTPSPKFQNTYSFFIKGFGYDTDAIPFKSAHLTYKAGATPKSLHMESTIKSDLALVSGSGIIQLREPIGNSQLKDMEISITEFSERFSRVLDNIEKLLSIDIATDKDGITLNLTGTLANPRLTR